MLYRHKLVVHASGDFLRGVQGLVRPGGDIHLVRLPSAAGHLGQLLHLRARRRLEGLQRQAHVGQQLGHKAPLLLHQRQEQVALLDLGIAVLDTDALGVLKRVYGLLGQFLHVHGLTLLSFVLSIVRRKEKYMNTL